MSRYINKGVATALSTILLLAACTDDVDDMYAKIRAFLRFDAVTAVHPLYTALNNPGMFCTVTKKNSNFVFTDADGSSATYPVASSEVYGTTQCVAGFIIGTPSVPNMNGQTVPIAYDLVCPTCYESAAVQRSLQFSAREQMTCPRCNRTYDLANGGQIIAGESGTKLYRYRSVQYATSGAGTLIVSN